MENEPNESTGKTPNKDFATFSEGLNRLKLKKNIAPVQNNTFSAPELDKLQDLEQLLVQLKSTNSQIKEELGGGRSDSKLKADVESLNLPNESFKGADSPLKTAKIDASFKQDESIHPEKDISEIAANVTNKEDFVEEVEVKNWQGNIQDDNQSKLKALDHIFETNESFDDRKNSFTGGNRNASERILLSANNINTAKENSLKINPPTDPFEIEEIDLVNYAEGTKAEEDQSNKQTNGLILSITDLKPSEKNNISKLSEAYPTNSVLYNLNAKTNSFYFDSPNLNTANRTTTPANTPCDNDRNILSFRPINESERNVNRTLLVENSSNKESDINDSFMNKVNKTYQGNAINFEKFAGDKSPKVANNPEDQNASLNAISINTLREPQSQLNVTQSNLDVKVAANNFEEPSNYNYDDMDESVANNGLEEPSMAFDAKDIVTMTDHYSVCTNILLEEASRKEAPINTENRFFTALTEPVNPVQTVEKIITIGDVQKEAETLQNIKSIQELSNEEEEKETNKHEKDISVALSEDDFTRKLLHTKEAEPEASKDIPTNAVNAHNSSNLNNLNNTESDIDEVPLINLTEENIYMTSKSPLKLITDTKGQMDTSQEKVKSNPYRLFNAAKEENTPDETRSNNQSNLKEIEMVTDVLPEEKKKDIISNIKPIVIPANNSDIASTVLNAPRELIVEEEESLSNTDIHKLIQSAPSERKKTLEQIKMPQEEEKYTQPNIPEDNPDVSISNLRRIERIDREETHYSSTVKDFTSIFKEKNYMFLRRRAAYLADEYYKNYTLAEFNIVDKCKKLPESYPEILETMFQNNSEAFPSIFKEVIGHDNDNKSKVIQLLEENTDEEPLVSPIKPLQTLLDRTQANDSSGLTKDTLKEVSHWRAVLCDGDSFYRSLAFALFQHYILSNNAHEVRKLVWDIYSISKNPEFALSQVDFKIFLVAFNLILEHLQSKQASQAYAILVKAMKNNDFDAILVRYVRLILYHNAAVLDKPKGKKSRDEKEPEEINVQTFLVSRNEPCKLALSLVPHVFNVNLDLFIFDGVNSRPNLTRKSFSQNNLNEMPVISLCYHLCSYSIMYTNKVFQANAKIFSEYLDNGCSKPAYLLKDKLQCERCRQERPHVVLPKYNLMVCFTCLDKHVQATSQQRAVMYNQENFINREYYARNFEIKEKVLLDESDVLSLWRMNISALVFKQMTQLCFNCHKSFEKQELVKLNCACQMCHSCLEGYVESSTKGFIILNKFEKKVIDPVQCCCYMNFDFDDAVSKQKQNALEIKEKQSKAMKRLEVYATHYCMRCISPLIAEGQEHSVKSSGDNYFKLKIEFPEKEEESMDLAKVSHLICRICVDKVLKSDAEKKSKGALINIPPAFKLINCKICDDEHKIDIKEWNSIFKTDCCSSCIIY